MLSISQDAVKRWRVEIDNGVTYHEKFFGKFDGISCKGKGENIEYYERGTTALGSIDKGVEDNFRTLINMPWVLKNIIVPSLYYRNPKILAFPKRKDDEPSAPVAAALLNYFFGELGVKETNQFIIIDAFLLGMGISKIGYATRFGMDIPDKDEEKRKEKGKIQQLKEMLGLSKPKSPEEPPQNVELSEKIIAESPYVSWVSPFDFIVDPRARSIYDAQWVAHRMKKTLDEVKHNKMFINTSKLTGDDDDSELFKDIPPTEIEKFKTTTLYEIHYKTDEGINILYLAENGQNVEYLYHDKSIYEMDGFQFEILDFNKHAHKLYSVSDIDIIKPLQDRITTTVENILDQLDKFVPKIGIDETAITAQGKLALQNGDIGAIVTFNKNPNEAVKELSFTQLKTDLNVFLEKMIDIIILESGLTRAQLMGASMAESATEAQIGQGGANIRLFARADAVQDFTNRQSRKLWQVIKQFVDLEEIQLITGEESVDEMGVPRFPWLEFDSKQLIQAELDFQIEVGSTQKPDVAVIRKEFENFINIIAKTDVIALIQQQGSKVDIAELIRLYLKLYPEMIKDIGRIIKPISPMTPGQLTPEQMMAQLAKLSPGGGQGTPGIRENMRRQPPPTMTSMQEQIGGEAGVI